jgi:hypothetical protein
MFDVGISWVLLYNFVQLRSRVTHPLCRDEFRSRSRVTAPSAECKLRDIGAKSPLEVQKKAEFSKISVLNAEFLEVSRRNSLVAEVPNRLFGSRVTTCAELNEIAQYLPSGCDVITHFLSFNTFPLSLCKSWEYFSPFNK